MIYLLIDNSNTRTKFCLADKTKLLAWQAWLPTHEIDHPHLAEVSLKHRGRKTLYQRILLLVKRY